MPLELYLLMREYWKTKGDFFFKKKKLNHISLAGQTLLYSLIPLLNIHAPWMLAINATLNMGIQHDL